MASSSSSSSSSSSTSRCWIHDVFPSFSGEDVRVTFRSHLLRELKSKSVVTFKDDGMDRGLPIGPTLISAIKESRIAIVVFSKSYASSTWCLNELVEIHKCYKDLGQMVIPVFYEVDPSHVRKQTGEFGEAFKKTCNGEGRTEDEKERWTEALIEFANMTGFVSQNSEDEAKMIERISKNVLGKLIMGPTDDFGEYVGIEAHIDAIMDSKVCLESEGVRMIGIVGPSGIGKTSIARALYNRLSTQFPYRLFGDDYKRPIKSKNADDNVKLGWATKFLSQLLGEKDLKIESRGLVKQRLQQRKVLIILDDVYEIELLEALVGQTEWFGKRSRIIVVTQDRALLETHGIELIYEVGFPSRDLALKMFCRSAFGADFPPTDFRDLAVEVTNLAGNLPLGLNVLGSSLKRKDKKHWNNMMHTFRNGLDGKIQNTLKVSYDELGENDDQDIFLYVACLFIGESVDYIKNVLENCSYNRVLKVDSKS